jgi:hypothetical protein
VEGGFAAGRLRRRDQAQAGHPSASEALAPTGAPSAEGRQWASRVLAQPLHVLPLLQPRIQLQRPMRQTTFPLRHRPHVLRQRALEGCT